jgi:hypothetical protein
MADEQLRKEFAERGLKRAQTMSWDRTADETWRILKREAADAA